MPYRYVMDMDAYKTMPLPDNKESEEYYVTLRQNCINMYAQLFDEAVALDYNGVTGKMRTIILEDVEFKKQTRMLKAKQVLEEIKEINSITFAIDNGFGDEEGDDEEDDDEDATDDLIVYDPRKPEEARKAQEQIDKKKNSKKNTKKRGRRSSLASKDIVAMKLKAAIMRRELLSLNRKEDAPEEKDAINIFFVPLTEIEYRKMSTVEIFDGTEDSDEAFKEETKGKVSGGDLRMKGPESRAEDNDKAEFLVEGVDYETDEDGNVIEL